MTTLYRQFLNGESSEGNALTAIAVESDSSIQDTYANLDMSIQFVSCSAVGHFSISVWLNKEEDRPGSNLDSLGEAEDKIARIKRAVEIAEDELERFRKEVTDKSGYVKFKKAKKEKKQP